MDKLFQNHSQPAVRLPVGYPIDSPTQRFGGAGPVLVEFIGNDIENLLFCRDQFGLENVRELQRRLFDLTDEFRPIRILDFLPGRPQFTEKIGFKLLETRQNVVITGVVIVKNAQSHVIEINQDTGGNRGLRGQISGHSSHAFVQGLKFPDTVESDQGKQQKNENRSYQEFPAYAQPALNRFEGI